MWVISFIVLILIAVHHQILEDSTNKAEIKAALDSVCAILPQTVSFMPNWTVISMYMPASQFCTL